MSLGPESCADSICDAEEPSRDFPYYQGGQLRGQTVPPGETCFPELRVSLGTAFALLRQGLMCLWLVSILPIENDLEFWSSCLHSAEITGV